MLAIFLVHFKHFAIADIQNFLGAPVEQNWVLSVIKNTLIFAQVQASDSAIEH